MWLSLEEAKATELKYIEYEKNYWNWYISNSPFLSILSIDSLTGEVLDCTTTRLNKNEKDKDEY